MREAKDQERTLANRWNIVVEVLRRAFSEFLGRPSLIIFGFLLLSVVTYYLDRNDIALLAPLKDFMKAHVFADAESTSNLLGAIAGSLITVTSITFSLLLVAVQQSAGSLSSQVFDQFLRRPINQIYFGFFLGLALFSLITLATVNKPFNPLFGATIVLLMTIVALYLLLLLIYNSIDQMRPGTIIDALRDHILKAREGQLSLVDQTLRVPELEHGIHKQVTTQVHGYLHSIDLEALRRVAREAEGEIEVIVHMPIGAFVAFGDRIAEVRLENEADGEKVCSVVKDALRIEKKRDIDTDPAYGIEQLAMIAWTSISTAKSNPAPAIAAVRALRDVLARWSVLRRADSEIGDKNRACVVYPDTVMSEIIKSFESLAVVASESMQHQSLAEIVHSVAIVYPRLPEQEQQHAVGFTRRMLSTLGDHVLTSELEDALSELRQALLSSGELSAASALGVAMEELGTSVGKLNSKSTRVPEDV